MRGVTTTSDTGAHAVFMPARETFIDAIGEALRAPHSPACRLYHDGRRCAWLPREIPGWYPINAAIVKEAS